MTVSETFPSWFIGKNKNRRVIEVSYGDELAQRFGHKNRQKIDEFGEEIFGIGINPQQASKTNWDITDARGGMISAGIGSSITGHGADLLLIDDPIKNRAEADSKQYRERLWAEWENTLLTRLHPGGRVVLIQTRWHRDDLAGRLLEQEGRVEDGGLWHVLTLPAVAEENDALGREVGEPLWPEHGYDLKWCAQTKKSVGSYAWASLYQQRPRPRDENRMLRREWFKIADQAPAGMQEVRYWDLAATEPKPGSDPDYTAGVKMGEKEGVFYITDIRRSRLSPKGNEDLVEQTAKLDSIKTKIFMEQEGGSSGKNTIDHYARKRLKGFTVYGVKPSGSKTLRAEPFCAAAEAGNVVLIRGAWNKDFLDEAEEFPTGDHDDQIDGCSGCFEALTRRPVVKTGQKPSNW